MSFTYSGSQDAAKQLADETGATASQVDSANRAQVVACVRAAGALDVLVVNAGVFAIGAPTEFDADAIDRMFAINIHSPYHASVEAARQMKEGGRIIVIGSANGVRAGFEGVAAYAMTKSAHQDMARGLARDLGARNITVNVVPARPDRHRHEPCRRSVRGDDAQPSGHQAARHGARDRRPRRLSRGPEAAFITGSMHTIDGGFTA